MKNIDDATQRFANRGQLYNAYRPSYPNELLSFLTAEKVLTPKSVIADIGSGTRISSKLFLDLGHVVYSVEPNKGMREIAESVLVDNPDFHSVNGTAEDTHLPSDSVDLVVVAQALHWFNLSRSKSEFQRILRIPGHFAAMWNVRKSSGSPFAIEYEAFLKKYAENYDKVRYKNVQTSNSSEIGISFEVIEEFFSPKCP